MRSLTKFALLLGMLSGCATGFANGDTAAAASGLFDIAARRQALQSPQLKPARDACLAVAAKAKWSNLTPVLALEPTETYGSDKAAAEISYAAMVLSGRALAGDAKAERDLIAILDQWAGAGAFLATKANYDPYFALKRSLLPLIVAYDIVDEAMAADVRDRVRGWLDTLVRRVDARFDGEVDSNNHRYLADAVLTLWGGVIDDAALVEKGRQRFAEALAVMRADGTLPLEARRGARALWYQRQTLANFTVIGLVDAQRGGNLFTQASNGRSFDLMLAALVNGLLSPSLVATYSAQNYIPGPEGDPRRSDFGFLKNRGNGRHYMAFAEALLARPEPSLSVRRLAGVLQRGPVSERPLIDEFIGGNATCFWWTP